MWGRCSTRSCSRGSNDSSGLLFLIVNGLQLHDLQLPHHRRQLEKGDLALRLAEQCASDGGRHGDLTFVELEGVTEDEVVGLLRARLLVLHHDLRPESDL